MSQPSRKLGNLLKESREKKGLTLLQIAQVTDSTAQYICDVEHGRKRMTYELVKPWSQALGIEPAVVLSFILSEKQSEAERRSGVKLDFRYAPKSQSCPQVAAR